MNQGWLITMPYTRRCHVWRKLIRNTGHRQSADRTPATNAAHAETQSPFKVLHAYIRSSRIDTCDIARLCADRVRYNDDAHVGAPWHFHAHVRLSESALCDVIPAYTAGDAGSGESADGRQPIGTTTFVLTILSSDLSLASYTISISRFLPRSFSFSFSSWTRGRIKDIARVQEYSGSFLNIRSRSRRLANSSSEMKGASH